MSARCGHHPPAPSSEEEGEKPDAISKAPSSLEEGVGGGVGSGKFPTRKTLLKRAAELRLHATEPERRLWNALRAKRFRGYKFRRQVVVGHRIVDFFCPRMGLAIEVDGDTHNFEVDQDKDRAMEREFGFRVVRFTNADVMHNLDGVLIELQSVLDPLPNRWVARKSTTPQPPPLQRRGSNQWVRKAPSSSEEGVGGGGLP